MRVSVLHGRNLRQRLNGDGHSHCDGNRLHVLGSDGNPAAVFGLGVALVDDNTDDDDDDGHKDSDGDIDGGVLGHFVVPAERKMVSLTVSVRFNKFLTET